MEVLEIEDLEDGSARMTFEMTDVERRIFFKIGCKRFLEDRIGRNEGSMSSDDFFTAMIQYGLEKTLVDFATAEKPE